MKYPHYRVYTGQNFEHGKTFDFQTLEEIVQWAKWRADISKFRFYTVFGNGYAGATAKLVMEDILELAEDHFIRGYESCCG